MVPHPLHSLFSLTLCPDQPAFRIRSAAQRLLITFSQFQVAAPSSSNWARSMAAAALLHKPCCRSWRLKAPPKSQRRLCVRAAAEPEKHLKQLAAVAVKKYLKPNQTVGLGSGIAINAVIQEIATQIDAGALQGVRCVPASNATASEAAFHGVPLTTLAALGDEAATGSSRGAAATRLDVLFEAADELDPTDAGLGFIIGGSSKPQQPQLVRARTLAAAADATIVLVDSEEKLVSRLGGSVPVVVEEDGWEDTGEELDDIFVGDADIWRRSNIEGAGPRGGDQPYVSPEGHNILDIRFYEGLRLLGEDASYEAIAKEIESVPGVVAHGLYAGVAAAALVAGEEGPQELLRGVPLSAAGTGEE